MSLRYFLADRDLVSRIGVNKNLLVRIDRNEIDPADVGSYHTVDGIVSAAADSYYFNVYAAFEILIKFKWHRYVLRIFRIFNFPHAAHTVICNSSVLFYLSVFMQGCQRQLPFII